MEEYYECFEIITIPYFIRPSWQIDKNLHISAGMWDQPTTTKATPAGVESFSGPRRTTMQGFTARKQ